MSSCWHCNLPPRTASTASGLIINLGRGETGRAGLLGPSGQTVSVCVCPALMCSPQPVSLSGLPCYILDAGGTPSQSQGLPAAVPSPRLWCLQRNI